MLVDSIWTQLLNTASLQVLDATPHDGHALTYRGLVSKMAGDVEDGVWEMKKGLK